MSSEDYPELPEVESDKGISLPQNELKAMIGGTSFAVSENQARPIHTGCLFEVEDSSITVVAVDGYRLALRRWKSEEPIGRTLKFVVPAAALKEAEKSSAIRTKPARSSSAASISSSPSARQRWSAVFWKANFSTGGASCRRTSRSSWR